MTDKQQVRLERIREHLGEIKEIMSDLPQHITSHFILDIDDATNMVDVLLEDKE